MENRNVAPPARVLNREHAYNSPTKMHDSTGSSLLCFTLVLQTTYYRGQLEGEILSATWGTPLRYSVALFTVPRSAFSLLAVRRLQYGKQRQAGRGTGNEATTNLKLQTVNDERQLATSQATPPASL